MCHLCVFTYYCRYLFTRKSCRNIKCLLFITETDRESEQEVLEPQSREGEETDPDLKRSAGQGARGLSSG